MAVKLTRLTHKIAAHNGRELYHLQFSLQTASSETFGYTFVLLKHKDNFTIIFIITSHIHFQTILIAKLYSPVKNKYTTRKFMQVS
jgi:hypothetical protein